ncbi:MAG: tryptophan synthase subunit alpha [Campylobacterales bacterium]|nr:tryptophan synthase subunit alpha [Campylobacterales bacterium]
MKKLVSYITTKLPENNFTIDLANSMFENGTDFIELGIPFSDPVADGPVIEQANQLSLKNKFTLEDLFYISANIKANRNLFWMGYFNSFYNYGVENICKKANSLDLKGFLIPDLPFEEGERYKKEFQESDLDLVTFVAPTDSKERVKKIVSNSSGFIYLVAYAGITGSGQSEDLTRVVADIKEFSNTPVYVGFGVDKNTAKEKAQGVDGVIVGSAFVKTLLDDSLTNIQKIDSISRLSREIKEKINS